MFPSRIDPRLAVDQRKRVEGQVPSSLLQRLAEAVSDLGEVWVELDFFRDEQRLCRVEGRIEAQLQLQCQRCLQDYAAALEVEVHAVIVWSEEQARHLPAELDPWQTGESLELGTAIEDELLLALPTMPVHREAECSGAARYSTEMVVETSKPFAGLQILKGGPQTKT